MPPGRRRRRSSAVLHSPDEIQATSRKDELQAIQARNLDSPDMHAALWEIARLRSLVLYMDQLQRMLGPLPGQQGDLLEALRLKFADEPCVKEFPKLPPDA